MSALVAVLLAAAPAWKVQFSASRGVDHGNGVIVATSDVTYEVTPTEVRITAEGTEKGKPVKSKPISPKKTPPASREAIAALLPSLPKQGGTFSISPYVDDEGWSTEALVVEIDGKAIHFSLEQGKQAPPLPPSSRR